MTQTNRKQVLDVLQTDWATYVERFHNLSPEAQARFLANQGYVRFADLLAHIIAWWEEGKRVIEILFNDPDFDPPDYDVDRFNAQAVERFSNSSESEIIQLFENTRETLFNLTNNLPDVAFQNQKIIRRFWLEVVGHLQEHNLKST